MKLWTVVIGFVIIIYSLTVRNIFIGLPLSAIGGVLIGVGMSELSIKKIKKCIENRNETSNV